MAGEALTDKREGSALHRDSCPPMPSVIQRVEAMAHRIVVLPAGKAQSHRGEAATAGLCSGAYAQRLERGVSPLHTSPRNSGECCGGEWGGKAGEGGGCWLDELLGCASLPYVTPTAGKRARLGIVPADNGTG